MFYIWEGGFEIVITRFTLIKNWLYSYCVYHCFCWRLLRAIYSGKWKNLRLFTKYRFSNTCTSKKYSFKFLKFYAFLSLWETVHQLKYAWNKNLLTNSCPSYFWLWRRRAQNSIDEKFFCLREPRCSDDFYFIFKISNWIIIDRYL
jgi:hypothetical protein